MIKHIPDFRTNKIFLLLNCVLFLCVSLSCDKYHAKKTAGTYTCDVDYHYSDGTPTTIDTAYTEKLIVQQKGKNITVLNYEIHIDSLWKEKEYLTGQIHNYIKVKFVNDSIYLTHSSGGLGGNSTWIYKGKK